MRRLTAEATVDLVPVTIASTKLLAAALKAGSYRSATAYLAIWKQLHIKYGHPWTADPTLRERWEQPCAADRARIDVAVVGAMWLLRGELVLVEQAEIAKDERSACLYLSWRQGVSEGTSVLVQAWGRFVLRHAGLHVETASERGGLALTPVKARKLIAGGLDTQALSDNSLRRMVAEFLHTEGFLCPSCRCLAGQIHHHRKVLGRCSGGVGQQRKIGTLPKSWAPWEHGELARQPTPCPFESIIASGHNSKLVGRKRRRATRKQPEGTEANTQCTSLAQRTFRPGRVEQDTGREGSRLQIYAKRQDSGAAAGRGEWAV